jgi:hypothetical protein
MKLACGIFDANISERHVPTRTKSFTMASVNIASNYAYRHTTSQYALILNTLRLHELNRKEETSFIYVDMKMNYLDFVL